MKLQPDFRWTALPGLSLAAAIACWWLGSTALALDQGSDPSRVSADALQASCLVRAVLLVVVSLRLGAGRGWWAGAQAALAAVAVAWPLTLLAWSASSVPGARTVASELALVVGALALPLLGVALRRVVVQAEPSELAATTAGVALAAGLWSTRALWLLI